VNISKTKKGIPKKENAILLCFEKPFKSTAIIFYFIGTLRTLADHISVRSGVGLLLCVSHINLAISSQ